MDTNHQPDTEPPANEHAHARGRAADDSPLRLLAVPELARIFGVGEAAIRKRIRLRQLGPVIRRGKGYVMRAEALRRYLEAAEREWEGQGRTASTTRGRDRSKS